MQPARDMIVVDALPGGTLDPSVDGSLPLYGRPARGWASTPRSRSARSSGPREPGPSAATVCGLALAEKGHE
jgi:hypothetical protein